MLDSRIASALNKTIQNSHFKKKVSLEEQKAQKEDRFLRGRHVAHLIYDHFQVTGARDTVLDYADLFTITFRNEQVQDFDTTWDETLLSMSKIPPDNVLESWYKLRARESDQLKTVLELYDMEIHQKISMPDCQKLMTMVKTTDVTPNGEVHTKEEATVYVKESKQNRELCVVSGHLSYQEFGVGTKNSQIPRPSCTPR